MGRKSSGLNGFSIRSGGLPVRRSLARAINATTPPTPLVKQPQDRRVTNTNTARSGSALNADKVAHLRWLYECEDLGPTAIAARFGLNRNSVMTVVRYLTWVEIDPREVPEAFNEAA